MTVEKTQDHFQERTVEKDGAYITLFRGSGTFEEYTRSRERVIKRGEDAKKPSVADIQIDTVDSKGNHDFADELVVRGRDIMATVKANSSGMLKEGEKANYYTMFVGEDARDVVVLSPDRKLVRQMTIDLIKKTKELGDEQDAFAWLKMDSPYAIMKSPYNEKSGLFYHGVPPSDMFMKKE